MKTKLLLLFIIMIFLFYKVNENFNNYQTSCKSSGSISKLLKKALDEKNIDTEDEWEFFIPCDYNPAENVMKELKIKKGKKIFIVDGCDWITNKNTIYELIENKYGKDSNKIMPYTYNLNSRKKLESFYKRYNELKTLDPNTKFIMKNREQRQEGLKMVSKLKNIKNEVKKGNYYLIQEYLNNPYLISKRKINLRYYLLIVCRNNKIEAYYYNDGFVYYTPKYFNKKSINFKRNITTGYIDRKVYEENPLTVEDFRNHLGKNRKKWDNVVLKKFKMLVKALKPRLCKLDKFNENTRFQIFGADLAPSDKLDCHFMELNKGPDLGGKDKRDSELKYNMLKGTLNLVSSNKFDKSLNFTKII